MLGGIVAGSGGSEVGAGLLFVGVGGTTGGVTGVVTGEGAVLVTGEVAVVAPGEIDAPTAGVTLTAAELALVPVPFVAATRTEQVVPPVGR